MHLSKISFKSPSGQWVNSLCLSDTRSRSPLVQFMAFACSVSSHCLNQFSLIVNYTLRHKLKWDLKQNDEYLFNSLAPGKFEWHFRYLIFQIISMIDGWGISCEHALRWMSLDLTDDKSTLVQVMAWCRQATSHYLSQWWPRSLSPYGVTGPQWVKEHVSRNVYKMWAILFCLGLSVIIGWCSSTLVNCN